MSQFGVRFFKSICYIFTSDPQMMFMFIAAHQKATFYLKNHFFLSVPILILRLLSADV